MPLPRRLSASIAAIALAGLACASAVRAQPSPWGVAPPPGALAAAAAVTPGSTVVAEIEVTKHLPGPALWKVVKGPSEVIILGAATPLPHMLQWDTLRMEHALAAADALYLQPKPSFSTFELMKLAVSKGALQLPAGKTLEQVLSPQDRGRFLHLVALIHAKPETYDRWKPALAGLFLIADWRKAAGLSEGKPATTVTHLAEDAHVPVRSVGDFKLDPYVDTAAKLSMADNIACFDAAMDDVDQESSHARAMADAWARADLKTVGETYKASLLNGCLLRIPSTQKLLDRGTEEGVQTIETALVTPGKSVAVIDLNFLLRPNGVLDRLRAEGATISAPD